MARFFYSCIALIILNQFFVTAQNRPQTPKPPYQYYNDSVVYENTDRTVQLGATFSIQKPVARLQQYY
jgi:hypothetical protein